MEWWLAIKYVSVLKQLHKTNPHLVFAHLQHLPKYGVRPKGFTGGVARWHGVRYREHHSGHTCSHTLCRTIPLDFLFQSVVSIPGRSALQGLRDRHDRPAVITTSQILVCNPRILDLNIQNLYIYKRYTGDHYRPVLTVRCAAGVARGCNLFHTRIGSDRGNPQSAIH